MKKIITITLALLLIVSLAVPASAATTGDWDLSAGQQHAQDTAAGLINGRTITYDYNGGWRIQLTGWRAKLVTGAAYTVTGTHTIPDAVPWRVGYAFSGWRHPNGLIYYPGDQIQGTGNMTLVAVWVPK